MKTALATQSIFSTNRMTDWPVDKTYKVCSTSPLRNRVALVGASLVSLTGAIYRAVLGIIRYVGYLITLGCWQQPKNFSIEQMEKAPRPTSISHMYPRAINSPKKWINDLEMRSWRIKRGTELIEGKLRNQFEHAQKQAAEETDKDFQYLVAPANFQAHTQSEKISDYEVAVCHFIGRRPSMEDEHLTTSFKLTINEKNYPVQLFGIFDGHGGGEASRYVRKNLERILHETLNEFCGDKLTDEAIWNALKITFVKLDEQFKKRQSGTTATVAMILNGKLWTANVGDSRTILDNGIQLSEDAKPTDPRYQKGIENRGGRVYFNRVNGILAVARAVGDHDVGAVSPRPKITVYPLSMIPKGTHLILTCDGIYDVSSTRQIAAAIRAHRDNSAAELAKNIVYSAYEASSQDNLSALVVKL